jgi:hypothetical protein
MKPYAKLLISVLCLMSAAAALATPPVVHSASRLHAPPAAIAPVAPGSTQQLNPQPLPPKVWGINSQPLQPGTTNSLNPQPLPPKVWGVNAGAAASK